MNQQPLPIGVQTFPDIIRGEYLYIDKTRHIHDLIRYSKGRYFIVRPRRFGKSLLISTLAELFAGNRDLFKGLWLDNHTDYNWQPYPVIRIDFSRNRVETAAELEEILNWIILGVAQKYDLTLSGKLYTQRFEDLIFQLAQTYQPVVILVDEYDKPVLDNIENLVEAKRIQALLKGFYGVIKGMDAYIRFVFLTGISKFSKVGVFSGLNNLEDITFAPNFSDLLGITPAEIDQYLKPHMTAFAQKEGLSLAALRQKLKDWYDGFCFTAQCVSVYNPFSLFVALKQKRFANFWFDTGTPTFLIELIRDRFYDVRQLETLSLTELAFSSYEIEDLQIVPLLFQTGYLTIKAYDPRRRLYRLYYPNYEVQNAFSQYLLGA